ncbi:MAG: hypothetical protein AB1726_01380 [Planctomycetota bacterium]
MARTRKNTAGEIEAGPWSAQLGRGTLIMAAASAVLLAGSRGASAQEEIAGWGHYALNSAWHHESFVQVAGGVGHSLARRGDGTVVAWGDNTYGQCDVPALPGGLTYVDVAAGGWHGLAVRSDGSAVGWGDNDLGQCDVPALPPGLSYIDVVAGSSHGLALRSDGTVLAWGYNNYGQCDVPAPPPGLTYIEVAAGEYHSLARLSDGTN